MNIKNLTPEELLCLVGLAKLIVQADQQLTEGEREALKVLGADVGVAVFKEAIAEASARFSAIDEVQAFAMTISREEARACIYEELVKMAKRDDLLDEEQDILDWLSDEWGL